MNIGVGPILASPATRPTEEPSFRASRRDRVLYARPLGGTLQIVQLPPFDLEAGPSGDFGPEHIAVMLLKERSPLQPPYVEREL